jgi:hypothetical protein
MTPVGIKQFNQLCKVGERPCQAIDLIDDDHVDLPGADVLHQFFRMAARAFAYRNSSSLCGPPQTINNI